MASTANQKNITTHITYSLKQGGFIGIPRDLFFAKMRELNGGSTFSVWCYLCDNQDGYSEDFSPTYVSELTGYSTKSIRTAINKLIEEKYLVPRTEGTRYYDFYPDPGSNKKGRRKVSNALENKLGGYFNV